jgi:hypothetical protein
VSYLHIALVEECCFKSSATSEGLYLRMIIYEQCVKSTKIVINQIKIKSNHN